MERLNITKNNWGLQSDFNNRVVKLYADDGETKIGEVYVNPFNDIGEDEAEANAILIADAGTTYNDCGILPSDLLKRNQELTECLEKINKKKTFHQGDFNEIRELLAKHKNQ